MSTASLRLVSALSARAPARALLVGDRAAVESALGSWSALFPGVPAAGCVPALQAGLKAHDSVGQRGTKIETYAECAGGAVARCTAVLLPTAKSRMLCPARPDAASAALNGALLGDGLTQVCIANGTHAAPLVAAVARQAPRFSQKPGGPVEIELSVHGIEDQADLAKLQDLAEGVRLAALVGDTPPEEMHPAAVLRLAQSVAEELGGQCTFLGADELREQGYGGLWGVGKCAALHSKIGAPHLIHMKFGSSAAGGRKMVLVGKGITYDTGGLKIKVGDGMCGMKHDCGGAAGVLGAARAIGGHLPENAELHVILCVAENMVGPDAFRNDDILHMKSGKTVEVNNTDAEGRLVLGDGVYYASQAVPDADFLVTCATLTGAQKIMTGTMSGALFSDSAALCEEISRVGKASGDLMQECVFYPEVHMLQFASKVADMKNSVKNRADCQSSAAASFIRAHLHPDFDTDKYAHCDIAGPAVADERATGFGAALFARLCDEWARK